MESPVFALKEEPASPLWELELLDEVGGIWEGDVEVVDEVELEDVFWGEQDISELIGDEEQILGLELDDIALDLDNEDGIDLKEGSQGSFYPTENPCSFGTGVIGSSPCKISLICDPKSQFFGAKSQVCDPESLVSDANYPLAVHCEALIPESEPLIEPPQFISTDPESLNDLLPESISSICRLESLTSDPITLVFHPKLSSILTQESLVLTHETLTPDGKCSESLGSSTCTSEGICTDPNCAESVCTDVSCCQNACSELHCPGNALQNAPVPQNSSNTIHPQSDEWCVIVADDAVPNLAQNSYSNIEPFSNWLDSGAIYDGTNSTVSGLPTYQSGLWTAPESPTDDKASVFAQGGPAVPADPMQTAPADLLREFEDVLTQAAGSLTPPDSPRSANGSNVLLPLPASHIHSLPLSPPPNPGFIILQDMANAPVVNDELDELVAETYQKNGGGLATISKSGSDAKNGQTTFQPKSGLQQQQPWDSPTSSSGSCDSGYEDPDWSPAKSADSSASSSDTPQPTKKLRLTSTEERRMRKKEQNKNAATRYRMKKKMEMEDIMGEEKELLDRNDSLKSDVVEITREIKYLKGLMGDLFRAKGLIRAK